MTRLLSRAMATVLAGLMFSPATAMASWPLTSYAEILLEYGSPYTRDGRSVTHSGVDLFAEPGDTVLAAQDGVVSFAGRVPAPGGGTRGAVTIDFGGGLRITCLPLTGIVVSRGQTVSAGDKIGVLGESAGESTLRPHLHVSVRRGEAYLDPMLFLISPGSASIQVAPEVNLVEPAASNTQIPTTFRAPVFQGQALVQAPTVPAANTVKAPSAIGSTVPAGQIARGAIITGTQGELAQTASLRPIEIQTLDQATASPSQVQEQVAASPIQAQESRTAQSSYLRELAADKSAQPCLTLAGVAKERRSPVSWWLSGLSIGMAALGLWPLWRRRPTNSGEAVMSVRDDDLAAAVCR